MNFRFNAVIFLSLSLLVLSGCVGPLVKVIDIDEATAEKLKKQVTIYEPQLLGTFRYENIQSIEATSCMNKIWDPPASKENAIDQLRYKTTLLGGNGLTNLVCEKKEAVNLVKNCWNSVTCYGVAINVDSNSEKISKDAPASVTSGTGFFINDRGYILTNQHVIGSCEKIVGQILDSEQILTVVAEDEKNDLALLKANLKYPHFIVFRDAPGIRSGDSVIAIGFPLRGLLANEANLTSGTVSALAGLENDTRFLQITAPVQPGNSGGPLLDSSGHLVGIVVGKLDAIKIAKVIGDIPQNINFAINSRVAETFLDAKEINYAKDVSKNKLEFSDIGSEAKKATIVLECLKRNK